MRKFFAILLCFLFLTGALVHLSYAQHEGHQQPVYYCPMHPTYTSDRPGDCPICNMKLVKKEEAEKIEKEAKTPEEICILHNCPMLNREGGCPMLVTGNIKDCPYCGAHLAGEDGDGVYISAERQQYIGVKKESAQKRRLRKEISTFGRVAYDPQLFVAQEEYLQALKAKGKTKDSTLSLIKEQAGSLVNAARQKLLLLGMSHKEVEELTKNAAPQQELYLPMDKDTAWIYMTVYEYEIGLVKEGQDVRIEAIAYPGETFEGKIISITPVLDAMTRSVNVRAQVKNTGNKLKPEMFVNAKLAVDLGEKLAVPIEAVMDTGSRKIVFIAKQVG